MLSFKLSLAAHCFSPKFKAKVVKARDISVVFGGHNLINTEEIGRYELTPKRIIIHDDYDANSTRLDADLALIRFKRRSISFNLFVRPICLWNFENNPVMTEGKVAGWGNAGDPTRYHENMPKQIQAQVLGHEKCIPGQKRRVASSRMFCGGPSDASATCFGDSGGGFFIEVNKIFYLQGIVSSAFFTSSDKCETVQNSFYTNVFAFKKWLDEETDLFEN